MTFLDSLTLTKTLPCLAEPGKIIVIAQPSRNLDGILPLVAAVAPNIISFNPEAGTLTLRRQPGFITFYPLIAMIWDVPVVRNASCTLLGMPESSPSRMPVRSEACGSGRICAMIFLARALNEYNHVRSTKP